MLLSKELENFYYLNYTVTKTGHVPTRGSAEAAGLDLYADISEPITLWNNDTMMISTGVAMEIPAGCVGLLFIRSSWAAKKGIELVTGTSVIDSDYRDEIKACIRNVSGKPFTIHPHDRFCQIVIMPYANLLIPHEVMHLSDTERGKGGFGSTG